MIFSSQLFDALPDTFAEVQAIGHPAKSITFISSSQSGILKATVFLPSIFLKPKPSGSLSLTSKIKVVAPGHSRLIKSSA